MPLNDRATKCAIRALFFVHVEVIGEGHRFILDADASPIGSANVHGHLWDNGSNPIDELGNVIDVRSLTIDSLI